MLKHTTLGQPKIFLKLDHLIIHFCVLFPVTCFNTACFRTYIRFRFLSQDTNSEKREIYPYQTTATDTNLVKNLFSTIQEIILAKILQSTGFQ